MTSTYKEHDGHLAGIAKDLAAWHKQVTEKQAELRTIYESMVHSSDMELAMFCVYTIDELEYHKNRIDKLIHKRMEK